MRFVGRARVAPLIASLAIGLGASLGCEWLASLDGTLKVEVAADGAAADSASKGPGSDAGNTIFDSAVSPPKDAAALPDFVFPPCSDAPGWQLDCTFGDAGIVLLEGASGDVPPALAVNSAGDLLEVAASATAGGTLYTTIGTDGGATTVRLDAGAPVDVNANGPFDGPTILSNLPAAATGGADQLLLTFFNGAGIGSQALVIAEPDGTSVEGTRVTIGDMGRVYITATHITSGTSYQPTLISAALGTPTTFAEFAPGENGVVPVLLDPNVYFVTSGTTVGPYGMSTTYVLKNDGGPPLETLSAVGVGTTARRFENGVLVAGVDTTNGGLDISTVQLGSDGGRVGTSFEVRPVGSSFLNVIVQSTANGSEAYTAVLVDRGGTFRFVALRQVGDDIVASTDFADDGDAADGGPTDAGDDDASSSDDGGDASNAGDAGDLPILKLPNIPTLAIGSDLELTAGNAVRFGKTATDPLCTAVSLGKVARAAIVCVRYVH